MPYWAYHVSQKGPVVLRGEKAKDGEITFIRTTLVLTVIWTVGIREYRLMRHLHLMII